MQNQNIGLWVFLIGSNIGWVILIFWLFKKGKIRNYIIKQVLGSKRIENKFKQQETTAFQPKKTIAPPIDSNEATIDHIVDLVIPRVLECIELENKEENKEDEKEDKLQETHSSSNNIDDEEDKNVFYFKTKSGKVFNQETNANDALFKVYSDKKEDWVFEYIGGVVSSDFLTNVCEFINNPRDIGNITKITTKTSGKVFKNADGNWEVTQPAKIEFA